MVSVGFPEQTAPKRNQPQTKTRKTHNHTARQNHTTTQTHKHTTTPHNHTTTSPHHHTNTPPHHHITTQTPACTNTFMYKHKSIPSWDPPGRPRPGSLGVGAAGAVGPVGPVGPGPAELEVGRSGAVRPVGDPLKGRGFSFGFPVKPKKKPGGGGKEADPKQSVPIHSLKSTTCFMSCRGWWPTNRS